MKGYRYDIIGAELNCGVKDHPQKVMKDLGFKVVKCEPVPIADCWLFKVENEIDEVPSYLTELNDLSFFDD